MSEIGQGISRYVARKRVNNKRGTVPPPPSGSGVPVVSFISSLKKLGLAEYIYIHIYIYIFIIFFFFFYEAESELKFQDVTHLNT